MVQLQLTTLRQPTTTTTTTTGIPTEFIWPDDEKPTPNSSTSLHEPLIDIGSFKEGGPAAAATAKLVAEARRKNGFFQVRNHGIDMEVVAEAHKEAELFFSMALEEKQKAQRRAGEATGYFSGFVGSGRFSSKLPWKENISFCHRSGGGGGAVRDYFVDALGPRFRRCGEMYERYCEAMSGLAMEIVALLEVSLDLDHGCYQDFYSNHDSIMRLNNYPPCQKPQLTLGTGPHSDPTALTILHQDRVGLEVFVDGKWHSVTPIPDAFVINIGDTLMAMTNGRYKSCLHRAVVNKEKARKSLTYFMCPAKSQIVRPPEKLVDADHPRVYPDFKWSELLEFTMKHYRADMSTIDAFCKWLLVSQRK